MPPVSPTARNFNHPKKGSSIKVDPIRKLDDIRRIKELLADKPRDYCLFTMGINTAYRACELVSLKVGQVDYLLAGDRLDLKQSKNRKYRAATLNENVVASIKAWLLFHPKADDRDAPLFLSTRTGQALRSATLNNLVKGWCSEAGLRGNFGSHTLRKTWGYHQRTTYGHHTAILTKAYGHASEQETLNYLCIQPNEVEELYFGRL